MDSASELLGHLERKRLIVCVGTGGVGKTTTAASMALRAARLGRRVLVVTIDPARRLADALGVDALDNEARALSGEGVARAGIPEGGSLSAMMIDMKRTFDDLVERFSDDPEVRQQIYDNPIYQHLSDTLAGSAEYAAMAKVYELSQSGDYDLVVVDTPPSQHALDFLDAPRRLIEFMNSRLVKTLVNPALAAGRFGFRVFHRATERILGLMERVTGLSFLEDISEFLVIFGDLSDRFADRAQDVSSLFTREDTCFIVISGATAQSRTNAEHFLDQLSAAKVRLAGIIINRMRLWPTDQTAPPFTHELPPWTEGAGSSELAPALDALAAALERTGLDAERARAASAEALQVAKRYASLVRQDLENTAPLERRAAEAGILLRRVPEFPRDVYDLPGLIEIGRHLFDEWDVEAATRGEAAGARS